MIYNEKKTQRSTLQADIATLLQQYTKGAIESAKATLNSLQREEHLVAGVWLAGATEAMERAKYLIGCILIGLPSAASCRRAIACLRRADLELEAFTIWGTLKLADVASQASVASALKEQRRMHFRGVFLDGTKEEWLEKASMARGRYSELARWGVPTYTLVKENDWIMHPFCGLPVGLIPFLKESQIGKRDDTLPSLCYPPEVDAGSFERAARGEGVDGWPQRVDAVTAKRSKREISE
ncbi:unnamed protein product, partial [Peniophora sp. CBMAI 1063]